MRLRSHDIYTRFCVLATCTDEHGADLVLHISDAIDRHLNTKTVSLSLVATGER